MLRFPAALILASCVAVVVLLCLLDDAAGLLPNSSTYRHLRVAQTKVFAGDTTMTVDDMWTVKSGKDRFLRVLCHWSNGFPPDSYVMKAMLLNSADGPVIEKNYTWYVPMPRTAHTPQGVTPFFWEFRIPPEIGDTLSVRICYRPKNGTLVDLIKSVHTPTEAGMIPMQGFGPEKAIDFNLPNVAVERDMGIPDFFASNVY